MTMLSNWVELRRYAKRQRALGHKKPAAAPPPVGRNVKIFERAHESGPLGVKNVKLDGHREQIRVVLARRDA